MNNEPKGELAIRVVAMPKDTNPAGDVFGGSLALSGDTLVVGAGGEEALAIAEDAAPALVLLDILRSADLSSTLCSKYH